jgi:hypothetical protein
LELLFFAIRIPDEFIIIIMGDNLTITTVKVIENLLMKPLQMKVILILIIVEAIVITTITSQILINNLEFNILFYLQ